MMKKIIAALAGLLALALPSAAVAQCSGIFAAGNICGNSTASGALAASVSVSALFDRVYGTTQGAMISRGASTWGASTTLPTNVQDNITRLGTIANMTTPLLVAFGGTSASTFTAHGILLGEGASAFGVTAAMTNGQLLVGQTSADPLPKSITGDWAMSAAGAATLATVNANVGTFGSATQVAQVTANAKGLVTALANVTIAPPFSAITGQATLAQFPTIGANTVISNWTSGSATPLANTWPACANDGSHALAYVNGTGVVCVTLSTGGTVTNVATAGLATGGPITTTGTVTVTAASAADQETSTSNTVAVTPLIQQRHPSALKAFAFFAISGGAITPLQLYNVTSLTYSAAGQYKVNFTTAFSNVNNYGGICFTQNAAANAYALEDTGRTASQFPIVVVARATGVATDVGGVSCMFFGDQ